MLYTNTDQFINKRDDLSMLICNDEPDLILLTETIPKAQTLPISPALLHIPGYTLYSNFTPSTPNLGSSGKRGVCVYVADYLRVSEVSIEPMALEHVLVKVPLRGDCLVIGCIYRSPSCDQDASMGHWRHLLEQASSVSSHLLLVGDFNIPQIDWELESANAPATHYSHAFLEVIRDFFLFQHVRQPTRFRPGETANILDLILTNEEGMLSNLVHLPGLGNSDHDVLRFTLVCYAAVVSTPQHRDHTDYGLLQQNLRSCNWSQMRNMNLEEGYRFFKACIDNAVEKSTKRKSMHSKKNLYMSRKALQLKKRKRTLWSTYCRTRDILDHARFVRCRNELRGLTRQLRREHERKLSVDVKHNPKAFWRYANSRLRTKCRVEDLRDVDGAVTSTNEAKAQVLSNFFSSVFTEEDISDVPELLDIQEVVTLEDVDVSPQRVQAKLAELKPTSSPGPDSIHPRLLRESASILAGPMSELFRKSIDEAMLPTDWKTGEIIPIFKKGDRRSPASYRPVSLTAIPSKVLESIVRDHLLNHFSSAGLLHDAQHGFLPKRSCTSQLMEAMEDWSAAVEDGDPVDVAYLDFSKAFDSVPHQRLLRKLSAYGISGKLLDWIEAFLVGRRQRVVVQGSKSAWAPVTSGIPQGSVLGPTLFTIFVNDMPSQVANHIKLFADDTKLYCRVPDSTSDLQADIDALARWSEKWLLPFNESKCKVMHIGRRNPEQTYSLNGTPVEATDEERDLGVIIDKELRFRKQAAAAVSKASQMLAVVRRSFANIDEITLPLLYKSMVRPFLEYGNTIWGPFSKLDQKQLERVQRRATRMVGAIRHLPYPQRLQHLGLPTLYYRRRRGDMLTVYQLLHGGMNVPPERFLTRNQSGSTRGHQWKLCKPRAKSLVRRHAFSTRVVNDWNALPVSVVSAETLNAFKARLDRHWANTMFDIPFP